jgi:hypothetical protein
MPRIKPLFYRRISPAVLSLCLAGAAVAQEADPATPAPQLDLGAPQQGGRNVWSLYWENDGAFIKPNHNTDRHYTNGARIVVSSRARWADELARWLPFDPARGEELRAAAFYSVGQQLYTPDRIGESLNPQVGDRRYAGWLYFSAGIERASATVADRVDLKVGVIGPAALGEKAQQNIHDLVSDVQPFGWDSQLGNRLAIDLDANRRWKFDIDNDETDHVAVQIIPEIGFTAGSVHTHMMAGATLRIGSPFLPGDFGAGRLEAPATVIGYPDGAYAPNENLAWSIYTRFEARAVLHNELLEDVEKESLFGMVQVGVTLLIAKNLTLGYSQTWCSKEFQTQVGLDSIAAVSVEWSFAY